jgi:hypothetical protein
MRIIVLLFACHGAQKPGLFHGREPEPVRLASSSGSGSSKPSAESHRDRLAAGYVPSWRAAMAVAYFKAHAAVSPS